MQQLLDGLVVITYTMPIFIITMTFGLPLWIRLFVKSVVKENSIQGAHPFVSVLLPTYNEGEHVLHTVKSIMACDWPLDKIEVIAIDDCSADDSYEWLKKAELIFGNNLVKAFKNETNSGKHTTLSKALKISRGEILICIDSDCIFEPSVIKELVGCFKHKKIGAVGGSIGIHNVNENLITQGQALIYWASFQVGKMVQNLTGKVGCISGCLFAIRRPLFESIEKEISERSWFGIGIRDGEDRYMTHEILMRGWETYINPNAQCWTAAPNSLKDLFLQQLRWRRSGLRDIFWTIRRLSPHIRIYGTVALLITLVPETFTTIWSFLLIIAIFFISDTTQALALISKSMILYGTAYIFLAIFFNSAMTKYGPSKQINASSLIKLPAVAVWHLTDAVFGTMLALFTFDNGTWGTRETVKK